MVTNSEKMPEKPPIHLLYEVDQRRDVVVARFAYCGFFEAGDLNQSRISSRVAGATCPYCLHSYTLHSPGKGKQKGGPPPEKPSTPPEPAALPPPIQAVAPSKPPAPSPREPVAPLPQSEPLTSEALERAKREEREAILALISFQMELRGDLSADALKALRALAWAIKRGEHLIS